MLYLFGSLIVLLAAVIATWRRAQTHTFRDPKVSQLEDDLADYAHRTALYSLPNYVPDDIMDRPRHTVRGWPVPR